MNHELLLEQIQDFECRNNISVAVQLCSDGSGAILEFWHDSELEQFDSVDQLVHILCFTNYRKENGFCIHPVERV